MVCSPRLELCGKEFSNLEGVLFRFKTFSSACIYVGGEMNESTTCCFSFDLVFTFCLRLWPNLVQFSMRDLKMIGVFGGFRSSLNSLGIFTVIADVNF